MESRISCQTPVPMTLPVTDQTPPTSDASSMSNQKSSRRPFSDALEPIAATLASSGNTLSIVKEALLTPFHGESRRAEGLSKLNDREYDPSEADSPSFERSERTLSLRLFRGLAKSTNSQEFRSRHSLDESFDGLSVFYIFVTFADSVWLHLTVVPHVISARSLQTSSRALGYGGNSARLLLQDNSSFTTRLGHYTTHIPYKQPAETSTSLAIIENVPSLLSLTIPGSTSSSGSSSDPNRLLENGQPPAGDDNAVSLIRGFKATIPTSELAKQRRRRVRGGVADDDLLLLDSSNAGGLGLKKLGDRARGLLTNEGEEQTELELEEERSRARKSRRRRLRKGRGSKGDSAREAGVVEGLGLDELTRQVKEIAVDKDNLVVRKSLIAVEIESVTLKIDALEVIRRRLEGSMIKMQEEELELEDERESRVGVLLAELVVLMARRVLDWDDRSGGRQGSHDQSCHHRRLIDVLNGSGQIFSRRCRQCIRFLLDALAETTRTGLPPLRAR